MIKYIMMIASLILALSFSAIVVADPISIGTNSANDNSEVKIIKTKQVSNQNVQLQTDITYKKIGDRDLKMHLLLPKNNNRTLPVIIFIKGSSWGKYKPQDTLGFIPQLVRFAKKGYIVASIEHRTSHEAKFPAQIHDVKAAVRYLKEKSDDYHINPNRIGVWGTSSGGHLAALLGTSCTAPELEGLPNTSKQSSCVQAVVDWYGPTDFLRMRKEGYNAEVAHSAESILIGGPILQNKEKVKTANPITYITKNAPPFLIMHGDKDKRVPFNQSELLYEALKKNGVDVTLYKVKGGGHGSGFGHPEIFKTVQEFFDRHL
ncbi:alpha/beta hydrolase fold [Mesobacillus persicus]|uniref:Alpha/beta hydrolase fold n=1 Tax=Mesobacillus persicus TaxID=930146 RepID=A0A1H8BFX5_9BACI|nr:alpha/beta hydrolase [Mesobacillus persicus]SEM80898.1 alpha/beta hydrolase fold [Mesobacillus persicus]